MPPEYGWLIEHHSTNPHRWLRCLTWEIYSDKPRATLEWHEEAVVAMRFARKEDAEAFAYLHPEFCTLAKITEHQFGV